MHKGNMLQDKVAVVTGSGRGIGRDIALEMAAQGAKVVVNDVGASVSGEGNDASLGQQVVNEIKAMGGQAALSVDSVSEWNSAARIVQCALDNFGRIDVVVNNAGILRDRMFFSMSQDEWKAVIDVHLNGTFYVSRAAAPHFKSQGSGAYVHMTSTSGLIGNVGQANYGAAKLGIVALSRSIAGDMKRYNVRSNCISPFAWSRMIGSIPTETPEQQARVEKLKKLDTAQIAPMAAFLASDAAAEVTSQIFAVRGNEIFLMSQPRPVRGMHTAEGWTPETIAQRVLPAMKPNFFPLESSAVVFSWDPV
ncbi:SDR family oxidoreductase [Ramlibacter albus]|uniref:SDR family oxidoreductase n=1 Tax=Ramlibacter albus TaxID=2079448 RepID=A0A923S0R4_9BURK|nr:SDR family oxidoreductase [Ramlibacter albus]MBC5762848.1 SDR family oxidoreductase [Ramlibacter albus]